MALTFDQNDRSSWYFGSMSRQDATDVLMSENQGGVFLVRDSATIPGDYVLCVREDSKVSHYIINKIQEDNQILYRIGDQLFKDLPKLLEFYKVHYLDTTPLIRPAPRKVEKVIAKFDFDGNDNEDLPFKKGEILHIIRKDEDQWWTARNNAGKIGSIPVPYIQQYDENQFSTIQRPGSGGSVSSSNEAMKKSNLNRKLPACARVKQARVPNAYDKTALKLEVGDIITVTEMNINGQWRGEINGRSGHFPFTHIEFIDKDNEHIVDES